MSDQQPSTKDQQTPVAPGEEDLISLEDLDQALKNVDPELQAQLNAMAEDAKEDLAGTLDILDIEDVQQTKNLSRRKAFIKKLKLRALKFGLAIKGMVLEFVKTDLPVYRENVSETIRQFGYKPKKFKRLVFTFIGLCVAVGAALYFLWKKGIPAEKPLFIQSIGEIAEQTEEYDPAHEQEPFYDNVRVAQNTLIMPKMAVNLKQPEESNHNSMAMAEFYVEGNSPEVVVEIKARETEFKDLFERTMEEFTGAELEDAGGKRKLLDRLAKEANRLTTKGRVQKVMFKTIVIQI